MENSSSGQVPHLYIYPLINPIAVGPHYTDRPLRLSRAMAKQELSQTNVFHQTAVWAALHKGIEAGRSEGMCAGGKLEAEPGGNQSELLRPPFLRQSHRGLRCVLHELIPPKLDCLC